MQTATHTETHVALAPATPIWVGRVLSSVAVLFLLLDGAIKVAQLPPAVDASAQLGYSPGLTLGIGALLLACLAVYLIPRTAPFGAILLTGYLGGAIATNVRVGSPLFSVIFPLLIAALLWGGLALRERKVAALLSR